MLWGGWLELSVSPEMILGSSENKHAGKRDCFVHAGIPAIRKQLDGSVPYVLTPWLAPLGRFNHDAFANVTLAALRGRFSENRKSERITVAAGCRLGQLQNLKELVQALFRLA